MAEILTKNEAVLQRALYHESQYRNALVSSAISFYDVNLTRDLIESDILFKSADGKFQSTLDLIGLTAPCCFSNFINTWFEKMISKSNKEKYSELLNIPSHLVKLYNEGRREYQIDYWIESSNNKIYLNQIFLLTNNEHGDICALSIVKDRTAAKEKENDFHKKVLEQYAYYDPVTHGYNYIKFKNKLREKNIDGSIISLDIHSFKIINSICGILKGDEVIRSHAYDFIKNRINNHKGVNNFLEKRFIIFHVIFH